MEQASIQERSAGQFGMPVARPSLEQPVPSTDQQSATAHVSESLGALSVHAPVTYEPMAPVSSSANVGIVIWSMLACVGIPFILACIYYLSIATPQYVAETRFAVRTLGETAEDDRIGGGGVLTMTSMTQDAYIVASFINSAAMLEKVSARLDIRALFSAERIDAWSRLPPGASQERLLDYWNGQVNTYFDGPSGIVMLDVRAFSPEDALMLARAIIEESETLANELSIRARRDFVRRAELETVARQQDYQDTLERLNSLQNETAMLDPAQRASETGVLLTGLLAAKLDVDARLFVLEDQAIAISPATRRLRSQQAALSRQIDDLRSQMAASGIDGGLSGTARRFSELEMDRMLAAELYTASRRNLAQAQVEALRKAVYLTVFVPPELAEDSRYPRRIAMPLIILSGLFVVWGIAALLWSSVEDHRR